MTQQEISPQNLKTMLFLGVVSCLVLFCGKTLGGVTGMQIALMFAVAVNVILYWFSDSIIFKLFNAKPIITDDEPLLHGTVAYLAEKADMPMPRIYRIEDKFPVAFSVGRNPDKAMIAVTTGLLKALEKDELAGVMAHELAHIQNNDTRLATLAAGVGGTVSALANMLQVIVYLGARSPHTEPNWIGKMVMSMVAPVLAILVHLAVSRSREYEADEKAAQLCGNPMWLAHALYKLERAKERYELKAAEVHPTTALLCTINPLHNKQWSFLFGIQPPARERINRLEALA